MTEPDRPDNCITVYNTTPNEHGRVMHDGQMQRHHGIQVRVRSTTHPVGWAKAKAIATALAKDVFEALVTISGSTYLVWAVCQRGNIAVLGKDKNSSRRLFTVNATLHVRAL